MDMSKAAMEKTGERLVVAMKEAKEAASIAKKMKKLAVLAACGIGTVTMVLPAYYALTVRKNFRAKEFDEKIGDNDILNFTSKEESMAFRRITIKTNQVITYHSMLELSRCRWLTHLDLNRCENIKMDVRLFGVLLNLQALCCSECGGLSGECVCGCVRA